MFKCLEFQNVKEISKMSKMTKNVKNDKNCQKGQKNVKMCIFYRTIRIWDKKSKKKFRVRKNFRVAWWGLRTKLTFSFQVTITADAVRYDKDCWDETKESKVRFTSLTKKNF